jgi:VIT1/CCC1 family predicted Fe2+/Mn2+ transporter
MTSGIVPHAGPVGGEQDASSSKSGALRAAIFGMNDGLVSNLSLIFGVAGSGVAGKVVVIAGFAGLLAGAFSMGAGEYVSMKVQREVYEQLIHKEAHEIATQPEDEQRELARLYEAKGIDPAIAEQISVALMKDPKVALETHAREELGIDMEEGLGSPWTAAGSSFVMFSIGAAVPLLPFLFTSGGAAVGVSAGLSAFTLFAVGGAMTILTGRGVLFSGARMLGIGAAAATITYGVGSLVGGAVG